MMYQSSLIIIHAEDIQSHLTIHDDHEFSLWEKTLNLMPHLHPLVSLSQIRGRISIHMDNHKKDSFRWKLVVVFEFVLSLDEQEIHGAMQIVPYCLVMEKE